eukprot:s332_g24.t1
MGRFHLVMKTALLSVVTIHALATGTSCKDAEESSLVQAAPLRSLRTKVLPTPFGAKNHTATSQSLLKQQPEPSDAPSNKTAAQPATPAAAPPEAPSDKTAAQPATPAAAVPEAPSDKTAAQPATPAAAAPEATPAAAPPEAPSDKTAAQPATPPEAPSDKTAAQPATPAAAAPEAPSDKTAAQPATPAAARPEAPSDKTAAQPATPAAKPPEAPAVAPPEAPTGVAGTRNMSVPAKASANQTAQPLVPVLPSMPVLDPTTRVVEIVVPNTNNSQSVIRVRNPDAIDIFDVNVSNPVASLRSKTNMPLKALAIHRVPTTIYSKNDSFDGLRHLRLQVESFHEMNSSVQDFATVSKDALLEMIKALQRASPLCHHWSQARLAQNGIIEQDDALGSQTDLLAKSLDQVVKGSIKATGVEVAKAAQKILENRQIWEAHANEDLLLKQQAKISRDQLAIELLGAVRHGITSLKTCAVAASVKVNLTEVRKDFFMTFDFGNGSALSGPKMMDTELQDVEKAINISANNLTLSLTLAVNLVQDAVLKGNASKRLNSAVEVKDNLTSRLYERVHLAENISHDTSQLPPLEDRATENLSMGTTALVVSATQAESLAKQLQAVDSSIQEMYQETLETDVHMKLRGLTLEKTLREALRTCAEGLRLARLAGAEVNSSLFEIFRNVHGIYGNASSPIEFKRPGELQSVTKLSALHTNSSNAHGAGNASKKAVQLSERRQPEEPEESKEVPWTLPDDPKADTTTLLFGVPSTPKVPPPKESKLLPNLLTASGVCLFLILGSVLFWIDDPGVTRSIDWYKCSRLPVDVIDLPGYGYAKGSHYGPLVADFIVQRKSLRLLYCLVDARTGIRPCDWNFYASLGEKGPEKASTRAEQLACSHFGLALPVFIMSSTGCRRVVVDPVNLVTWGGGLMPTVGSLEPRIREKALYNAVPDTQRSYIKDVTGEDVEIKLVAYDWPSAEFVTSLSQILIQEALGYKAKIHDTRPFSVLEAILSLTGCNDLACEKQNPSSHDAHVTHDAHVVLESWLGAYGGDYEAFGERHPDKVPADLGSMGYAGEEAMFVSPSVMEEAYEASGHSLNWYRSYNASRYFSSLEDLPISDFSFCNDSSTMWTEPAFMNGYASTAYAIPAAVGVLDQKRQTTLASAQYFYSLARTHSVLSYWFRPDTSQIAFDPQPIVFPTHSASEWAAGNKRTAAVGSYIGKLVSRRLREHATSVVTFLENLKLELMEMQQYLGLKNETTSWEQVACHWILSNRPRGEKWIPKETTCIPGFGLVDAAGSFVSSRNVATGCGLCTPGSQSLPLLDEVGRTYRCGFCDLGTYQESSGETLCISCPVGRIAAERGLSQCEACPPGSYADASGLDACSPCGGSLWTTSRRIERSGTAQWIQIEGAVSSSYCRCIPGWFLNGHQDHQDQGSNKTCQKCTEGADCPGSNEVEVLSGYFSFSTDPGSVYRCRRPGACPGGFPGSCAVGRDNRSVACSACRVGLHPTDEGCELCKGQEQRMVGFVKAGIYIGQLAVSVQDPFLALLKLFSFISFEDLVASLNAISCVTQLSPTWQFLFQTVAVPIAFMTGPVLIHLLHMCRAKKTKTFQMKQMKLHVLGETLGLLCMLFFIVLCTAVLDPFDCVSHPNGRWTMRTATDMLCNFQNDHLSLALVASCLTLLPTGFVSLCTWIVLKELPRRLHQMDVRFVRSCSFLISRFRPGSHTFAIFLLVRNAVVAMAPILPSVDAGCFLVLLMLCTNLCLTAMFQPWLSSCATYMDMLANFCFLIILFQGAFFVENVKGPSGMIVCSVVLSSILLLFLSLSLYTLAETLFVRRSKRYDFFLTHHKQTCGSVARLIKLELQQCGCRVFLDIDDLSSLAHLFATLSQNVEALVVIASPNILTRKWCVGEIVTAHMQKIKTMVVALPKFYFPDAMFIEAFDKMVGDFNDLATYGLGKSEVRDALRSLRGQKTLTLPEWFQPVDLLEIIEELSGKPPTQRNQSTSGLSRTSSSSSCLILANHDDMEALATAHVLRVWMFPHLLQKRICGPFVIAPNESIYHPSAEPSSKFLVIVCTKDCLEVVSMIRWITECYNFASFCHLFPIIADEEFHVPGAAIDFRTLAQSPNVSNVLSESHSALSSSSHSSNSYLAVIRVLFTQIASRFSARHSAESTLKPKAAQFAERLTDLESLRSLLSIRQHPSMDFEETITRVGSSTLCDFLHVIISKMSISSTRFTLRKQSDFLFLSVLLSCPNFPNFAVAPQVRAAARPWSRGQQAQQWSSEAEAAEAEILETELAEELDDVLVERAF